MEQHIDGFKALCQQLTGNNYNLCPLNLHPHGMVGMSWYSDSVKGLTKKGAIASTSLGYRTSIFSETSEE